jgi:hypothetical protein
MLPFALRQSRTLHPGTQALGAVEHCRMGRQHLPLEVVVSESISDAGMAR